MIRLRSSDAGSGLAGDAASTGTGADIPHGSARTLPGAKSS